MRHLTALRYQIAITFCLITIISTGCTALNFRSVDANLLERNKNKTFKLGIVKAAWWDPTNFVFQPDIDQKEEALYNIPIAEICEILSSKYSISFDLEVDGTVKVVTEQWDEDIKVQKSLDEYDYVTETYTTENAYYGNLEYEKGIVRRNSKIINKKDFPDVINVYYSGGKNGVGYDISITSSGEDIVVLGGFVGLFFPGDPNPYVDNARRISEALKRDLLNWDIYDNAVRTDRINPFK